MMTLRASWSLIDLRRVEGSQGGLRSRFPAPYCTRALSGGGRIVTLMVGRAAPSARGRGTPCMKCMYRYVESGIYNSR